MAKPSRSSRKNKKAWRRNVDASDLESGLERKAAARIAAATAAAEQAAADAELFFVDKDAASASAAAAAATAAKTSSRRLKGAAALKRPLRCQLVTARPPIARRVPASLEKPPKKNTKVSARKKLSPSVAAAAGAGAAALLVPSTPPRRASASSVALASSKRVVVDEDTGLPLAAPEDIWKPSRYAAGASKPNGNLVAAAELSAATATAAARRAVSSLGASAASFVASSAAEVVVQQLVAPRRRRPSRIAPIPAVEVDAAGCSYNPDAEQHQDAVGVAVAAELAKDARRLAISKAAPPRLVDMVEGGGGRDELSRLLADTAEAVSSSDDEGEEEKEKGKGEGAASSSSDDDDGGDGDGDGDGDNDDGGEDEKSFKAKRSKDPRRKTTAERNRAARAKALRLELAARKAARLQRADLASLPVLKKRLAAAEEAKALSLARRAADRAERERERPPHLGRKRWAPADVQVLPTDEITGSLLRLRPYTAVSRDRFASLQKRGRIEVRTPAAKKKRAIKLYEPEGRSDRLVEAQEALDKVKRANEVAAAAARG
jgi:nucleolar protein 53